MMEKYSPEYYIRQTYADVVHKNYLTIKTLKLKRIIGSCKLFAFFLASCLQEEAQDSFVVFIIFY